MSTCLLKLNNYKDVTAYERIFCRIAANASRIAKKIYGVPIQMNYLKFDSGTR